MFLSYDFEHNNSTVILLGIKYLIPVKAQSRINCAKEGPVDLSWRNINAFSIETAIQNSVIGQLIAFDIYGDNLYVLAFCTLYPLLAVLAPVSFDL